MSNHERNPAHPQALNLLDLTPMRRVILKFGDGQPHDGRVYVVKSEPYRYELSEEFTEMDLNLSSDEYEAMASVLCADFAVDGSDDTKILFMADLGVVAEPDGSWNGNYVLDAPSGM